MSNIKIGEPEWKLKGWQYIPEHVTAVDMEASVAAGRDSRGPVCYGSTHFSYQESCVIGSPFLPVFMPYLLS